MAGFWWRLSSWLTDGIVSSQGIRERQRALQCLLVWEHEFHHEAPVSWPHLNPIISQRPHLQIPPLWGLGLWNGVQGDTIQSTARGKKMSRPSCASLLLPASYLPPNLYSFSSFEFYTIHLSNTLLQSGNKDFLFSWIGSTLGSQLHVSPLSFLSILIPVTSHTGNTEVLVLFPSDSHVHLRYLHWFHYLLNMFSLQVPQPWVFFFPTKLLWRLFTSCFFNLIFTLIITCSFLKLFTLASTTLSHAESHSRLIQAFSNSSVFWLSWCQPNLLRRMN